MGDVRPFVHPAHVEAELQRLMARMEALTDDLTIQARDAGEAEALFKAAYARAWIQAQGSVTSKDHTATLRTATLFRDRRVKEALYHSGKEALATCRAQVDALRTIASNLRHLTGAN